MIANDVLIVCTDKGQHARRSLALLVRADSQRLPAEVRERGFFAAESLTSSSPRGATPTNPAGGTLDVRATVRAEVHITDTGTVHVPRCASCGRAPRLTRAQLEAIGKTLAPDDSGRVVLDISLLPN